jgi:ABC-type branched-subunit amino acid transport system permease subunit
MSTSQSPLRDVALVGVTMLGIFVLYTVIGLVLGFSTNGIVNTLRRITFLTIVYGMLALALNLQWGYAGIFNIGVAGFMAVGVWTLAILTGPVSPGPTEVAGLGLPLWIGIVGGMLAAALVGLLAAVPALRLKADYLAIATLALSEIIRITLNSTTFQDALPAIEFFEVTLIPQIPIGTGGGQGIGIETNPLVPIRSIFYQNPKAPGSPTTGLGEGIFSFFSQVGIQNSVVLKGTYALVLVVVLAGFYWLVTRVGNSPYGRVLKAIREDEMVARSLGKNTRMFKIKTFMLGCALMGLAAILWKGQAGFVNPSDRTFRPIQTFYIFLALIIGGSGSNTGSILGGAVFAGILFEGPPFIRRVVQELVGGSLAGPSNIADATEALFSGAIGPFLAYMFNNITSLQFILLGVIIVVLMQRRPDGLLGHRKETAAGIDLSRPVSGGDDE